MRRLARLCVPFCVLMLVTAWLGSSAGAAAAGMVTVRLDGLNRAGHLVAVPQAELVEQDGFSDFYQGAPVRVSPGSYVVAAEVPTYSASHTLLSQTLVTRRLTIRRSGTIKFNARAGRLLRVGLAGATAHQQDLAALACVANTPGGQGQAEQGAWGGDEVAVYAVPTRSDYVSFYYLSILQAADGARYYLIGSERGGIPTRLTYRQHAADLAKMTMVLRSGAFGSSSFDWDIESGNGQSFCGGGQSAQAMQPQSWVNYLTPGTWLTGVAAYSADVHGNLYRDAYFDSVRSYRAHASYSNIFGGAVAGPGASFPALAGDHLQYGPVLFDSPGLSGGSLCCSQNSVLLRLGSRVVKKQNFSSSCQSCFQATLRRAGWYTLLVAARRRLASGDTPASLLSPRVAVSFRFHAAPTRSSPGTWQNFPVTDATYQPLGLNLENQAPASGTTKIEMTVGRPGNAGTRTPIYRLRTVRLFVSFNDGATWRALTVTRRHGGWSAIVHDPSTGYVSLRSIVADARGDSTEQTVYRAYGVT
jgi:hypothetical protein